MVKDDFGCGAKHAEDCVGSEAVTRVFAREVQHKGLASISMAVAVALHFFQGSGDRPKVGGVEGHVEVADPGLATIGAGQNEVDHTLVRHIIADGEGKGVIEIHSAIGVYGSKCGGVLRDGNKW